ncbi:hypothetical protein [Nocardioides daejeonensis]|uniref:hypothetical protein n=1 Tax=Nocardioides daejeonensis TaxID=1046556 RepID=UPI000D74A614|nr:hypothetical protein [Nocardioides daejeonensis]
MSRGILAVGLVVVLALTGLAVHQGLAWRHTEQRVTAGQDAVDAAAREVTAFISISKQTSDEDVSRLLDGATGGFRTALADQVDEVRRQAVSNKVRSVGEINSAGLEKLGDDLDRATVVVAASGLVRNKNDKGQTPRRYRFRVEMRRTGDRWLVAGLEFVS